MRALDHNWWTSFCFFVAAVVISCSITLYRASVEEAHYRELFGLYVRVPPPVQPTAPPASEPSSQAPSPGVVRKGRGLDI